MLTIQQLNNLRDAAKHARQCELQTKVPCELTLSQWALESGWGAHSPGNNCFGIKEYTGCPGRQLLNTYEFFTVAEFNTWLHRKYGRNGSIADATHRDDGRFRYFVLDWFATFPTLAYCFIKRASLFQSGQYGPFMATYRIDGNLVALVNSISPIYATDPDYSNKILGIASLKEVQAAILEARNG